MPQLDPTWFPSQVFWLAITFFVLYLLLSRRVLPPLQAILARRREILTFDLDRAQVAKSEAEEAREDYERTMAEARVAAQTLVIDALKEQKAASEKSMHRLDAQVAAKLAEAEKKIERAKQELSGALNATAADLAGMIVEKLTHKAPEAAMVKGAISQLSKSRRG